MAFTRVGYGQVEPNQLSAQKTGQIYASLPLDSAVNVLQNGEFMFYDKANGSVNSGKEAVTDVSVKTYGEPMLVFNEIKLYEPFWRTSYKDFAMIRVGETHRIVTWISEPCWLNNTFISFLFISRPSVIHDFFFGGFLTVIV